MKQERLRTIAKRANEVILASSIAMSVYGFRMQNEALAELEKDSANTASNQIAAIETNISKLPSELQGYPGYSQEVCLLDYSNLYCYGTAIKHVPEKDSHPAAVKKNIQDMEQTIFAIGQEFPTSEVSKINDELKTVEQQLPDIEDSPVTYLPQVNQLNRIDAELKEQKDYLHQLIPQEITTKLDSSVIVPSILVSLFSGQTRFVLALTDREKNKKTE